MNKSPRILMLLENESYPEDCRVLLEAESLVEAGYRVTVICPTDKTGVMAERIGQVDVYRYPKPWQIQGFIGYVYEYAYSLTMLFLWSCFVFVRRGFDVIHVHTPPDMTATIAIFFKLFGKRFVFDLHDLSPELFQAQRGGDGSPLVSRVLLWFERLACRWADRLIATNETQRKVQVERCGAHAEHCYIVRNGPNELFLTDVVPNPRFVSPGQTNLGYVGVIGVQDGVDYFVRCLQILKTEFGRTDFHAIVVGGGPALEDIKQLAIELGVAEQMTFTGMIPFHEVPSTIAAFDICITPDPSNAYNDSCTTIKTMEYMALRKPTVCFETTENENTAGEAAIYASDNDISHFARLVRDLMDDPTRREQMGQIGRERIENGLTWAHQAQSLVACYDDLFAIERTPTSEHVQASGTTEADDGQRHAELAAR